MIAACANLVGQGVIRGVLDTVDCQTRTYAQGGYLALTQGSSVFQSALTALLTIYVAWFGYRMLFAQGNTRLSDATGIGLKIGVILTLVTSWSTFQALVFDVADRAPVEIAALVSAPLTAEGRSSLAANPIDGLQAVYDEFSNTAVALGKQAGTGAGVKAYSSPQAASAEAMSTATGAIFLAGPGVIAAATLAIGILTAVGPIFIALALIPATRGLFVGWVRALAASALIPMVGWLLVVLMLSVLEPWVVTLEAQRKALQLDPQTAMSAAALVFVFSFGQGALVIGACVMAMGFRLPRFGADRASQIDERTLRSQTALTQPSESPSRAERLALDLQRDQAQAGERSRAGAAAAAAAASAGRPSRQQVSVNFDETRRLGETYRRPAVAARRAGAAR
ncbi:type IV secretion system protein [uncultured Phenylobacterium sp.]|uniref:type IV secretion system protein n=1 Tax=uncultured Phenylobacterium sp. TaxID=349273 RepID=UPI0025EC6BE5|nr:type IV secretion system protein [uncultured Phenylobacterium sp.]